MTVGKALSDLEPDQGSQRINAGLQAGIDVEISVLKVLVQEYRLPYSQIV